MILSRKGFGALAPALLFACAPTAASPIEVIKSASCGCCNEWVEHLRKAGFVVKVTDAEDTAGVSRALGVPEELRSCHSAKIGGFVVEGHVHASDIQRLLIEKPAALGIAVPGMPIGSPGMEQGDVTQPYATVLFNKAGRIRDYDRH